MKRRWALLVAPTLVLAACGGGEGSPSGAAPLVLVSAPLSSSPWIGQAVRQGAELAAATPEGLDGAGGTGTAVRVEVLDNAGSPQRVLAHARRAVSQGAVALVLDGVGARAVAELTDPVGLPVFVVFEGGDDLVDPERDPTLFRLAPANRPMTRRLADYVSERAQRVAVLGDDSGYGREGQAATVAAFERNDVVVTGTPTLPQTAADASPAVLAARRDGAQALVVWAQAPGVAAVLRAARSAGWDVPVFAGPTAEDPLVRQRLADRPEWLDGTTFVSFRITSEVGPAPFAAYRAAHEERFGPIEVGVQAGGREVLQPPDWSTYAYDAVRLVQAGLAVEAPLLEALQSTVITGANGDERGYGPSDREGVSPDDMYFARFQDMRFAPVRDDVLSEGLPAVDQ